MKKLFLLLLLSFFIGCHSKECTYDDSFLDKNVKNELSLKIIQKENNCNNLRLIGDVLNYNKEYKINKELVIRDSSYSISDTVLFDFSNKRNSGILRLNDSLKVNVDFLIDIPTDSVNFRLFKTSTIDHYYSIDLSYVFIVNYRYGIVGEFILGKENKEWFSSRHRGFIPNEQLIFTKFKKGELL